MPRLNGYDACRRNRERPRGKGMAVIAVTGWGEDGDRRRAVEAGFHRRMAQPVDPQALMNVLAELQAVKS